MGTRTFKCTGCKNRFDSSIEEIRQLTSRFHSKQCRLDYARAITRKANDKVKLRKTKAKTKKANSISTLTKKCDKLWSEIIRLHGVCEYDKCNNPEHLNAHHIIGRSNKGLRWSLINGICLCAGHHIFNSSFSAHKQPLLFTKRLEVYKGTKVVEKLTREANSPFKVTSEYLLETIEEFKQILKDNE